MVLTAPADIAFGAIVSADRVTIEKQGRVAASARASPDGGSRVAVEAPKANGRKTLRNVRVEVNIAARLADPREQPGGPAAAAPAR